MFKITKKLPTGRVVTKNVTADEYIKQGWREQGWVAPASLQKKAEDYLTDQIFDALRDQEPSYLRGLTRHYTIAKKLPNGKWATKSGIAGGDWEFGGWKNQGWIIPSWAFRDKDRNPAPKETEKAKDYYLRNIRAYQSWWHPKRTLDQANEFVKGMWFKPGPQYMNTVRTLRSYEYQPNPAYKKWQTSMLKWTRHNRKKIWKSLTTGGYQEKRQARIAALRAYKRRKAPQPFIKTKHFTMPYVDNPPTHHFTRIKYGYPGQTHY